MKPLRNNRRSGVRELVSSPFLFCCIVGMVILLGQSVGLAYTSGISDEPTLHNGQRMLLDSWTYHFHAPQRGDMVTFEAPPAALQLYHLPDKTRFVKRIIGLPGDSITINNTQVIVNGVTLHEPYVVLQGNPDHTYEYVTVPKNEYWVMGDDRLWSGDSREWGFVPRQNIEARVVAVLWPIAPNSGYLPNWSGVYQGV
jgi:signal peptidase I